MYVYVNVYASLLSTPYFALYASLDYFFSVFCCGFFARDDDDVDVDDKYSLFCYLAMCARHSPSQAKVKQRSCSRAKTTSLLCLCLSRSLLLRLRFKVSVRLALQLRRRPWQWFWCRCGAATARWSLPVLVCHSSCCCCFCAAALNTNGGWHSGQRGNGCMCVCVPERILRQAFLTFPCGSLCQFNLFFMPHAASYCDCDADADGDRGFCTWRRHQKTLLCGRVCFEMGVREAKCAENNVQKSFAFAILRHGCSICSLTLCHTHTHVELFMYLCT